MAKFRTIKNSLLGGQISPTAFGRTDLPQYPHACALLQNIIPLTTGGGYRRPGTLNVDSVPVSDVSPPRLIPFVPAVNEPYCLMLASEQAGNCILTTFRPTGNITGNISDGSVIGTLPYQQASVDGFAAGGPAEDDLWKAQYVQSADIMWLTHGSYKPQQILRTAVDTFTVQAFDAGLSGLALLQAYPYLNQNTTAETMTPAARTGSTTLTRSVGGFTAGDVGAIYVLNQGGTIGAAQITSVSSTTVADCTVIVEFGSTSAVATWWEPAWSNKRGWPATCAIYQQRLALANSLHQPDSIWFSETANYAVFSPLGSTVPAGVPQVGDVIPSGASVAPVSSGACISPVDDSEGDGQTTGPTGAQPFRITLSQNALDAIQWLSADKQLLIGTLGQEWLTAPENNDFSIGDSPAVIQSGYGSDNVPAVRIGYELVFPMGTQDELRAYQYNYIDASFFAEPVQLLFDQYPIAETGAAYATKGRRKYRSFQWDVSRQTLWCLDTAGNFFGMTRDRKLSVTMWHTHQFGGYNPAQGAMTLLTVPKAADTSAVIDPAYFTCDGQATSFAVVPNPVSGIRDVWVCVKRTITGGTTWQVERMIGKGVVRNSAREATYPGVGFTEPYLVDACVSGSDFGDPTDLAMPADVSYLNGYAGLVGTYYTPTNGIFKLTSGVVASGGATISSSVPADFGTVSNFFCMGLPYTPIIEPVRVDSGSVIGTAIGAIGRIHRCFINVFKTMTCEVTSVGPQEIEATPEPVIFGQLGQLPMGFSPEIYTGLTNMINTPGTYSRDSLLQISAPDPLPFQFVSLIMEGDAYD